MHYAALAPYLSVYLLTDPAYQSQSPVSVPKTRYPASISTIPSNGTIPANSPCSTEPKVTAKSKQGKEVWHQVGKSEDRVPPAPHCAMPSQKQKIGPSLHRKQEKVKGGDRVCREETKTKRCDTGACTIQKERSWTEEEKNIKQVKGQ